MAVDQLGGVSDTEGAAKAVPFQAAFLIGEYPGKMTEKTMIPAGKSVTVNVRMDWRGTGSNPTEPFMNPLQSGQYRLRLPLVFEAEKTRQFIASSEQVVESPGK
jgi:hypothetical protein